MSACGLPALADRWGYKNGMDRRRYLTFRPAPWRNGAIAGTSDPRSWPPCGAGARRASRRVRAGCSQATACRFTGGRGWQTSGQLLAGIGAGSRRRADGKPRARWPGSMPLRAVAMRGVAGTSGPCALVYAAPKFCSTPWWRTISPIGGRSMCAGKRACWTRWASASIFRDCAATGATDDLIYVSPRRDGRCRAGAGADYATRLFPLPQFLRGPGKCSRHRRHRETD